ncbi:MAG: RDD family protein [Acidobacteriaceae bacterium]
MATIAAGRLQRSTARTASLGDRLIASTLDSLVILAASTLISAWSFRRWGVSHGDSFDLTSASLLMAGTLSGAVLFLYLWLLEACFGATLGKIIVGIRVTHTTAHSALAACAIRNALRIVDGIGFYVVGALFAGCSQFRQRLGDILAGTVVVEEMFSPSTKLIAVLLWLATLSGAGFAVPRIWYAGFSSPPPPYLSGTVVQLGYTPDSAYVSISGLRVDLHREYSPSVNGVVTVDSSPR